MLRNKTGLSIVGRSQQRYFPRQKVSNTEKKQALIVPWYSKKAKEQKDLEKMTDSVSVVLGPGCCPDIFSIQSKASQ